MDLPRPLPHSQPKRQLGRRADEPVDVSTVGRRRQRVEAIQVVEITPRSAPGGAGCVGPEHR